MKAIDKAQDKMTVWVEQVSDYLSRLTLRERIMVVVATTVVVVAGIGSALWFMHGAANIQQKRLNELKDL